jgi:hypothetical protein
VAREKKGGGRPTPRSFPRGPWSIGLTPSVALLLPDTRLSRDCEVRGGVFSFPKAQLPTLFDPSEYSEHAEALRAVMSLSGPRSGSCKGEHDCR